MPMGLDEVRIKCPKCGKMVPAMKYCIYCGSQLPAAQQRPERPRPMELPPPPVPPLVQPPTQPSPTAPPIGLEGEVMNLMSNTSSLYARKVALFKLFQSGEVSEKVFLKLYNEYSGKLSELLNIRVRKLEELRRRLDEVNRRLNEIALSIEELSVRYKIGEVDLSFFSQRSEKLKAEQKELESMARSIRLSLDRLEKLMSDKTPSEIKSMESDLRMAYEAIKNMVSEGKVSSEVLDAVKVDVEETIALLDSLVRDRKERERVLREELETLNARYKIGEISVEEYERRKKEIQEEINKVWS
ncbi:MAG: SHOCT domain-containing protein [Candidatus Bathyarchaeia archaeon]